MIVRFEQERVTKNTIKFAEIPEDGQEAKVGTVYVKKATLKEIGWKDGKKLIIDLTVE